MAYYARNISAGLAAIFLMTVSFSAVTAVPLGPPLAAATAPALA